MRGDDGNAEHPEGEFSAGALDVSSPSAPDRVFLCDETGKRVDATADAPWSALGVSPAVVEAVERGCARVAATSRPWVEEVALEAADGRSPRVVECLFVPGPGRRVTFVPRDVSDARRNEARLRESERRYRLLAENASDMISLHDPEGRYLYVSHACRALTGYEPGALIGRSPYEHILADDAPEVSRLHQQMLATGQPARATFRGVRLDGSVVWLETTSRVVLDPETGLPREIQCVTRDVDARVHAEAELRASRELLQSVLDNSPAVVYIKDVEGRYLLINRRYETLFGVERASFVGRTDADFFPPALAAELRANDRRVIEGGVPLEFQEFVAKEGEPRAYISVKFPLFDARGAPYAMCGISTDITARVEAERAVQETSSLLRSILDSLADAVLVADDRDRLVESNPAAELMFGASSTRTDGRDWMRAEGLFLGDMLTPFPMVDHPLARAVRGESVNDVEIHIRREGRSDGIWALINGRPLTDASGSPRGGVIVCRDITERKAAEERLRLQTLRLLELAEAERQSQDALKHAETQLVQAEKLTALGQMVAGVAHEVNNPLAFVSNNVAVLQRDVTVLREVLAHYREADAALATHAPEIHARLNELAEHHDLAYVLDNLERLTARSREGLRRIQQIVRDLRDFSRSDKEELETVDLNVGVASTVNIIHGRARAAGVELSSDLHPLPLVTCQPGKIYQVVMNLLANAIDACHGGGHVGIRTEPVPETDGARIVVTDDGQGIPASIRDKIFDPFFTTKPVGQGTGLGLSISYGIVQAHGGQLTVASEPGKGSTFTVWLPRTPRLAALPKP